MAIPPSSPGWNFGFVPSPTEWNQQFANKVDYPAPIDQGGTGAQDAAGANYLMLQRQLIAVDTSAVPLTQYYARTSVGAITLLLPALSTLRKGDWIDISDVDWNADANNITVTAAGADEIALYDAAAGSQTLNIAGVRATLVVNNTNWRMLV